MRFGKCPEVSTSVNNGECSNGGVGLARQWIQVLATREMTLVYSHHKKKERWWPRRQRWLIVDILGNSRWWITDNMRWKHRIWHQTEWGKNKKTVTFIKCDLNNSFFCRDPVSVYGHVAGWWWWCMVRARWPGSRCAQGAIPLHGEQSSHILDYPFKHTPRVMTSTGTRVLHSCAPSHWNNLSLSAHSAISIAVFKKHLKTSLRLSLSPIDTNTPDGPLMLRKVCCHCFNCHATEPGFNGGIGAMDIWLIG